MTESAAPSSSENPKGRDDVVFRSLGKEWVVYDPRTQLLHVLNTTAALVWSFSDGARTPEGIADELVEVLTDLPARNHIIEEVRGVLDGFQEKGLLE